MIPRNGGNCFDSRKSERWGHGFKAGDCAVLVLLPEPTVGLAAASRAAPSAHSVKLLVLCHCRPYRRGIPYERGRMVKQLAGA